MKNNKLIILSIFIVTIIFTACVKDGDYSVPNPLGAEENENLTLLLDSIASGKVLEISIDDIKNVYFNSYQATYIKDNVVVKGYVTSSDEFGNFYQEFYMQDAPQNPTSAIKVALNLNNSYTLFNIGREVYIRLKGLYVGETRNRDKDITIGGFLKTGSTEVTEISNTQLSKHIFRSTTTKAIVPMPISLSSISNSHLGMLVNVNNVFFNDSIVGKPYFDINRNYDTERMILQCKDSIYSEFYIETSSFANFGTSLIPSGGGNITAIVTKDYDRNLRLALNTKDDVVLDEEKCTPF